MGWLYVLLAGLGEIFFIIGLKHANKKLSLFYIVFGSAIVGVFLNQALMLIDSSIVYPLWVSIGSFWSLIMGAFVYGERLRRQQMSFIGLLFFGSFGLLLSAT